MSLTVAPEEDRLVLIEEEGRRLEDMRRLVGGRVGVVELVMFKAVDDLLFGRAGIEERLSWFRGREVDRLRAGDCTSGVDSSMCNRGVSCEMVAGEEGGNGVVEALFKNTWSCDN